jgi:orotidine-5'-phosphate decarboxylase
VSNPILVALDVETREAALGLANTLRGAVGGFKIGSRLFTAEGPSIVHALTGQGDRVFLDLKFHDIPNTVATAVEAACALGVWMVNVHAAGGMAMMQAARQAAHESAAKRGIAPPLVIAVTVLTSMNQAMLKETGIVIDVMDQVLRLAELTREAGLDGVVASPRETAAIRKRCGGDFAIVTPGIRDAVAAKDDQQRTMTAAEAIAAGSSYLVVGRPIIAAADPREAAARIARSLRGTASTSP